MGDKEVWDCRNEGSVSTSVAPKRGRMERTEKCLNSGSGRISWPLVGTWAGASLPGVEERRGDKKWGQAGWAVL